MNILYIAYSCSPYHGSEDKIGWNIPLESAKMNRVFVITKEEQREYIEKYLKTHEVKNIKFYYVDIPDIFKKVFRGALYSGRCHIWNQRAYLLAKKISKDEKIEIIHQITPIEFRSLGDYHQIPDVKFVCGPIAGGQMTPKELVEYTVGHSMIENIRTIINKWAQTHFLLRDKLQKCAFVWFANYETKDYLCNKHSDRSKWAILPDVSISIEEFSKKQRRNNTIDHKCVLVVVGRLVYLKGHSFLLDALARIPKNLEYDCIIVGDGPEKKWLEDKCKVLGLEEKVFFVGDVPHYRIDEFYDKADVLILPSLREATGTVLAEAMARGIPAVTIDKFGGSILVDNNCGWLYDGSSKEKYIENLKQILSRCITNPEEISLKGANAREKMKQYTWEKKMEELQNVYYTII